MSGRIELFSPDVAKAGLRDCVGHPSWQPPAEWLGAATAKKYPLHLLSDQPARRLHSQLDHAAYSVAGKRAGREIVTINTEDAKRRNIAEGDVVILSNDRGRCLACARITNEIMPGVVRLSTGAWFDPAAQDLDPHGNPNHLTLDVGASGFSQGCSANSCLVEVERFVGDPPETTAHRLPQFNG